MENKYQVAKNYNFVHDLKLHSYVDAKDTVNHWCVGMVADIDEDKQLVKIHFEGWTPRYDEWNKKTSQKLAPFRRHTQGYTGQKKTAFREFKYSQTQEVKVTQIFSTFQMTGLVTNLINSDFKTLPSGSELSQLVRGELYFYVDSLISLTQSAEELPTIYQFMNKIFQLIFKWMEIFPAYLKNFSEAVAHPQLYLVDVDTAISQCGSELFSILEKCFGACPRCYRFFQRFGNEPMPIEGDKNYANKNFKGNNVMNSLLNAFGNMRGFDKVLEFISFETKDAKGKTIKGCPFILVMKMLKPFIFLFEQVMDKQYSLVFAAQVQQALQNRLDNLQDFEIKELDKDILRETIDVLRCYIQVTDPQNADMIAEVYELKIAEKYLRCPFFERRVRGLNDLKDIYYKVMNFHKGKSNQYEHTKWLTQDKYAKWIIDQKILEFIFIENPHVELIKRSNEILKLLVQDEKLFSAEIIEMLWSCCKEKHEEIVRATLDLIKDLAENLPLERLAQLFQKIQSIKENEFDEKFANFLKNYTIKTMKNLRLLKRGGESRQGLVNSVLGRNNKTQVKIDDNKFFDLQKFWSIFQDSNKIPQKVKDLALNSLIDILSDSNDKEQKDYFIGLCLENIKKQETFYSSLVFLRKILGTYQIVPQSSLRSAPTQNSVTSALEVIFKKSDFFDMVLANTNEYMKQAQVILKQRSKTTQGEKISLINFIPQANHEEYVKIIFKTIEFILVNSKAILTFEHVEKMFQLFVVRAISEIETNLFFAIVTKDNEVSQGNQRKFLLEERVRNEVFLKIFCNNKYLNIEKINLEGFICFKRLFIIVNEEEKLIDVVNKGQDRVNQDKIYVNNLNQLSGMDTLWLIAIQCGNQQVKDRCKDFLVDIYLRIKVKSNAQKKQINEIFPQKCLKYFKESQDRSDYQLNCLRLIKTFISRFDGDHILEEDLSQYDSKELKTIVVTLNPDKATANIKVHPNQKFWQLKRRMANQFKLRLSEFFIKTKNGPLEESVYEEQIKEYKIEALHINRVPTEEMEKEFPRYLIGYSGDYLKVFLELYSIGQEECKREVLSLLEILPINLEYKVYLKDNMARFQSVEDWQKTFLFKDNQPSSESCYFFMALEELMIPKREQLTQEALQQEINTKLEFSQKLIQQKGHLFLLETFIQIDKRNLESDILKTKLVTTLLHLINNLLQKQLMPILKLQLQNEQITSLLQQALEVVSNYISTVNSQQNCQADVLQDAQIRPLKKDILVLTNAYKLIAKSLLNFPQVINTLYEFNNVGSVFRNALIDIEVESIQKYTHQLIFDLSTQLDSNASVQPKPSYFFMQIFINECFGSALKASNIVQTRNFFEILNEVFTKTEIHQDLHKIKPILALSDELARMIFDREIYEVSARDEDIPLQGIFSFLKNIFIKYPDIRDTFPQRNVLLRFIIHECLFHKETRGHVIQKQKSMPPKCKNQNTRDKCLELLNELCLQNIEGIHILIQYLRNYTKETFWRTPRKADWAISIHQQERSLTGFVGLKNIGCICYMNSLMQQLFMIPTFRKSILEVNDDQEGKVLADENPLYQLKMIFGGLSEIEKQYFNPKKFCSAFKDIDGCPIDPMVQRDVEEFFTMMIDKVENLIKGKKEEKVIKNLFQGVFANEFICKGCPHYSQREEPFLTVQVQVKNKHSLKESLEAFVEGEMLEGDNAYFCEKCEKKVNTLKRCCIKRMPNVLFVVLKRFEFNYDLLQKIKINDYCEFPDQINMSEYSQEHLAKKDLLKEMEDKNLTYDDLNEDQKEIIEKKIPQRYYDYKLKGAIIHIGTSEQGHYISIIQDRENPAGKWYEFNDHLVKEFDPADIPYEAYGGDDDTFLSNINMSNIQGNQQQMASAVQQMKTKIKNAYILIYEREEVIDMERFNEFMDDPQINTNEQLIGQRFDQCKLNKTTSAQIQIPITLHETILEKNKKFWLSRFIFNKTYIESVLTIFKNIEIQEDKNYEVSREMDLQKQSDTQLEIFKFITTFFLTTVIRAKERKTVPSFMKMIRSALQNSVALSIWFLETFSSQELLKEFLIDCPIPDMKRFVGGLLRTAMQTVYVFEEKELRNICQEFQIVEQEVSQSTITQYVDKTQELLIKHKRVIDMAQPTTKGDIINTSPQCQTLTVYHLTHHNKSLPVLILFINSLIHLSVSAHILRNLHLTGQFYQVFAHFAELGESSKLYLLKSKTLGRLLDVMLNGDALKAPIPSIYRNETLSQIPLFFLEKEFYIKSNKKNDIQLSLIERRQAQNQATPFLVFLSYTVAILARSCRFVKLQGKNPHAIDELNFKLDNEEIVMLINNEHDQWWNCCNFKVSRNAISEMFACISYENKDYSNQILGTILSGLSKSTFDTLKAFERPLVRMLMIKDSIQADRTKIVMQRLQEIMKSNTSFYKEVDSLIDIVLKLVQRCPAVIDSLSKQSSFYRLIEQWQKENPHFPLNQTKVKLFKQGHLNWNTLKPQMVNQSIIDKVSAYNKDRLLKIQQLVSKEQTCNENAYDSDDDLYHHDFQEGDKLDFWQASLLQLYSFDPIGDVWLSGRIEVALDEMIKCVSESISQNQKASVIWIETDSDKISAPNTQTMSEKRRMNQYYLTLLKTLQNQQSMSSTH